MDNLSSSKPIRVLLIDDHPVVLTGYRRLLETTPDIVVVAEAGTGEEGYFAFLNHHPDVVVLDLQLPGRSGLDTLQRLQKRDSAAKVLVVSVHDNEVFVKRSRAAGAYGFLSKRTSPLALLEAIRRLAHGEQFFDDMAWNTPDQPEPLSRLTAREFEVFRLLAQGHDVRQIAQTLQISPKTAGVHQTRIMSKLDLDNLAQLTLLALRYKVIPDNNHMF